MIKQKIWFDHLNSLKTRLTTELGFRYAPCLSTQAVQIAVNDADAIAASSPFPLLVFPTLADEKVRNACLWHAKQLAIKRTLQAA